MFVQVIKGPVSDASALKARVDEWLSSVKPGSIGWLGTTGGVTPDGTGVLVARFDSAEAAKQNSDRAEQGAWWAETEKVFSGPVTFQDSDDGQVVFGEPTDKAGFVQVMQYKVTDRARLEAADKKFEQAGPDFRPDVLGGLRAWHADGSVTDVIYFTSEGEARAGEKQEMPPELAEAMSELMSAAEDMRYLDLPDPWLVSP